MLSPQTTLLQSDIKNFYKTFGELITLCDIGVDTPYNIGNSLIKFVIANCVINEERQVATYHKFNSQIKTFMCISSITEMDDQNMRQYKNILRQLWSLLSQSMRNRFIHMYYQNMYIYT